MFIKQHSYAQDGEDIFIFKYFKYLKVVKGTYLDIGAFHPLWLSKTHLLHKMGWYGYAVDVSDEKLRWFRFLRGARCKTIKAIISEKKNKTLNLYSFNNNILILINTIAHGESLHDLLEKALPQKQVFFIRGEVEVDDL